MAGRSATTIELPSSHMPWSRRSPPVISAPFHYRIDIQPWVDCADRLADLASLPGNPSAANPPL